MDYPKISVIVPVYKVESYLSKCIDSILSQTFSNFELILVDDGSPDRCPEICDMYAIRDKRIQVIHQPNCGVSAARNAGLQAAKGVWVWFVDSDDWVEPDALMQVLYYTAEDIDLVVFECKERITISYKPNTFFEKYYFTYALGFGPCNKLYRSSLIKENKVNFDEEEKIGEDLLFNAMFYKHMRKAELIPNRLYHYMDRDGSAMKQGYAERPIQQMRLYKKISAYYGAELSEVNRCVLFLMHLMSGFRQSKDAGATIKSKSLFLKKTFSEIQFGKTVYEQATNCFLNNESASLLGTIRLKLFLYFCSCGAYVLATLLL